MPIRLPSFTPWLAAALLLGPVPRARTDEPDPARQADQRTLAAQGIQGDSALLDYFRKRTLSPQQQEDLKETIRRLGAPAYRVRARAAADLLRAGRVGMAFLERARQDRDPEIVRRASLCLARIQQGKETEVTAAAARQLGRTRPAGAAAVLIAYLPFAGDPGVQEAIQAALNEVSKGRAKPEAVLVEALEDREPLKRGAAGECLTRAGPAPVRDLTARLLHDTDAGVRLQTALAFAESQDKRGVPVLIALLAELPADRAWPAEETLLRLAGDDAPRLVLGGDQPAAKVRDAWADWWRKKSETVKLDRLTGAPRMLGYTLIVVHNNGLNGSVIELGRDNKPRWQISNVRYPMDAQVVGRGRVLVAEYIDRRVTERDTKNGNIVWEKQVNMPIGCERLPNRKTLIVSRNQVLEVDARGGEKVLYSRADFTIAGAKRLPDGGLYVATHTGTILRLDRTGKEVKTFQAGQIYYFGGIDAQPNGRVLVPEYRNHRVAEYDAQGKLLWQVQTRFPTSAVYLPNGHVLVASMLNQEVLEVNREGKTIWRYPAGNRVFRARRR